MITSVKVGILLLLLRAYAHAVFRDDKTLTDTITSNFNIKDVHFKASSVDNAFSKDDQLLADKLAETNAVAFNFLEDRIRDLIEGYRDVVVNGNDNLPPLDPLLIPSIGPFVVEVATATRADLTIRDFHMDGLRWFVLDDVTFNPIRLTFGLHLTLPRLTFTGNYGAEAKVGPLVIHRAGGNYRVFIHRFELSVELRLGTNLLGGHLLLRELDVKVDVQDVNYVIGVTDKVGIVLNKFSIKTVFTPLSRVAEGIRTPKDIIPYQSPGVYKIDCSGSFYIVQTKRTIAERVKEHIAAVKNRQIRVDGMFGSTLINAFINNLVQSITQDFVQNEMENISQTLSLELFDIINELLKDYTLADILG